MLRLVFAGLAMAAAVSAQSPLTTTFLNDNGGSVGGGVYFDLTVAAPITVTALDLNLSGTGSVEVYTLSGSRIGNQTNPAAWTLTTSGTVTGAIAGAQSPVAIAPFFLAPGSYGVALKAIGVSHNYTNGTGSNQNYATTELALAAGEASNAAFVAPLFTPRVVNCRITYSITGGGTVLATNTTLGAGCVNIADVSSYENFATSAAFDLANSSITLLRSSSGYLAIPGITSYLAPSGTAQVLALGDDSETTVALTGTMPIGPTSSTSSLTICSNGYVSSASGNGTGFTPAAATFLNGTRAWWSLCWHDMNPAIVGSGQVKFEQIGTVAYVTWDGVWDFAGTSAASANTMQAQFDVATGNVHYVYGTMSTAGNGRLVGFSDAGPSADPGSMDISAALPGTYTAGVFAVSPLALAATSRPVTGTSWGLNVTNIPPTGVIGVDVLGLSDPGINDLFFLGMPGCGLRASLDSLGTYLVGGSSHAYSLGIPNNPTLLNAHIFTTSAVFQVPPVNAFGAITSNGIDGKIGDF